MTTLTASSATEEYLQAIYTLADEGGSVIGARLAEFLRVSPPAVSEMLHRLKREELIRMDARKEVHLSESGSRLASSIVRRHRLAERMLVDLLGYEWWKTHEEAERIEHAMSAEMEQRLIQVLGDPQTCPHGNPMPGAKRRASAPIESLALGAAGVVERIPDQFEHEPGFLEYCERQGLRPGATVRVLEPPRAGGLRLEVDGAARQVRADVGQKVWVRA